MPDEDQNIGTQSETPTPQSPESSPPASTDASNQPEHVDDGQEVVATPSNTIGDALKAFESEKQSSQLGIAKAPIPSNGNAQLPPTRDYTGLEPHEVNMFKNMGNQAFKTLKPMLLEYKQLKTEYAALKKNSEDGSKNSFFEHEQAFQLTPEYQSNSKNLQQINAEAKHWQEQLGNLRGGKQWSPLVLDEKGNVVIGEPQDPSPDGEAIVMNALTQAHILRSDLNNKLSTIQTSFKGEHQNFVRTLKEVDQKIFQGADQEALSRAMKTKLPLFPGYMHGNQLVQSLAKSLAVIDGLVAMLNEKKSATVTTNLKAKTSLNAGPSIDDMQPVTATAGSKVGAVWKEFADARMQGAA